MQGCDPNLACACAAARPRVQSTKSQQPLRLTRLGQIRPSGQYGLLIYDVYCTVCHTSRIDWITRRLRSRVRFLKRNAYGTYLTRIEQKQVSEHLHARLVIALRLAAVLGEGSYTCLRHFRPWCTYI